VLLRMTLLGGMTALAVTAVTPAQAFLGVTLSSPGIEYSGAQYTLGFEFTVASNMSITALGVYDSGQDGLNGRVPVGLWDTSGNLLASAVVPAGTSGTLVNDFRFVAISPYALTAGTDYVIGAYAASDLATSFNTGQGGAGSANPSVTIIQDRFSNFNSAFSFPDTSNDFAGGAWLGANFATDVPEPSTWALTLLGFAGIGALARRASRKAAAPG
jgi:hypothetical protein